VDSKTTVLPRPCLILGACHHIPVLVTTFAESCNFGPMGIGWRICIVGALSFALVIAACSSASIGASCLTQADCSSLTVGNEIAVCSAGVCTRGCTTDSDCGCASGTKPGNGTCSFACINQTLHSVTTTTCTKTCTNNTDCHGNETCQPIYLAGPDGGSTGQLAGWSTCLPQ
jgi:hypothetical protein